MKNPKPQKPNPLNIMFIIILLISAIYLPILGIAADMKEHPEYIITETEQAYVSLFF